MKAYAIYHQFYPDYKYEASIESIWTDLNLAETELKRLKPKESYGSKYWIQEVWLNNEYLHSEPETT